MGERNKNEVLHPKSQMSDLVSILHQHHVSASKSVTADGQNQLPSDDCQSS